MSSFRENRGESTVMSDFSILSPHPVRRPHLHALAQSILEGFKTVPILFPSSSQSFGMQNVLSDLFVKA